MARIINEKTVTRVVKEITYKCDICGDDFPRKEHTPVDCSYCARDVCSKCSDSQFFGGDNYLTVTCVKCKPIVQEYHIKTNKLEEEIMKLEEEMYSKCRVD